MSSAMSAPPGQDSSLPRLLVTGAGGFVGQALRRRWADSAWAHCFQWVEPAQAYDLQDAQAVQQLVAQTRPDAVLHLAAQSFVPQSFRDPAGTFNVNLMGTLHLLQALQTQGFRGRFLFVSTADLYGLVPPENLPVTELQPPQPRNPYAVSKASAELLCRQWQISEQLDVVIARPFNHVGVGQEPRFVLSGFARQAARIRLGLDEPRIVTGNLQVSRDFSSVDAVLDAYLALFQQGQAGLSYNVCSGREWLLADALQRILTLAGVEAECVTDPALLRPAEQTRMCGSPARLMEHTGWRPETSLDSTLVALIDWWVTKEKISI